MFKMVWVNIYISDHAVAGLDPSVGTWLVCCFEKEKRILEIYSAWSV